VFIVCVKILAGVEGQSPDRLPDDCSHLSNSFTGTRKLACRRRGPICQPAKTSNKAAVNTAETTFHPQSYLTS
ncbi:MAG: hypothetical protein MN733_38075, partial [Nitrososphaera sp.]|nr:hypothetical protein [Nitrososphaera sp.]